MKIFLLLRRKKICVQKSKIILKNHQNRVLPYPSRCGRKMLSYINLGKVHTVLEPSAGTGNILREIAKTNHRIIKTTSMLTVLRLIITLDRF